MKLVHDCRGDLDSCVCRCLGETTKFPNTGQGCCARSCEGQALGPALVSSLSRDNEEGTFSYCTKGVKVDLCFTLRPKALSLILVSQSLPLIDLFLEIVFVDTSLRIVVLQTSVEPW